MELSGSPAEETRVMSSKIPLKAFSYSTREVVHTAITTIISKNPAACLDSKERFLDFLEQHAKDPVMLKAIDITNPQFYDCALALLRLGFFLPTNISPTTDSKFIAGGYQNRKRKMAKMRWRLRGNIFPIILSV
jgi:hypothetical protein